ncbi:MAG TPA: hypothetical protein PLJ48_08455, partial [Dermatophilaceae bacterium]|nr:hypothetical protein [Dermatophilaceae bacterium]
LGRVASLLMERGRRREVRIRLEIPTGLPEVLADPDQIQQLFLNLVQNALDASHLRLSQRAAGVNLPIIALVADLLARGRSEGSIVRDVDPLDLHLMMTSMALFRITNAPTIEATFGLRMGTHEHKERQIALVTEMVLTWLTTPDSRD